jgi:hypothetical protein
MKQGPMNARHAMLLLAAALLVTGCQQEAVREIDWAKAALSRNPNFEILATDETAGVFTVRDTASGDVSTLKLSDLVAAPLPARTGPQPAVPAAEPAAVESPDAREDPGDATLAADQTTETIEAAPAETGPALAEGPGYRITRATGSKPEPAAQATLEGPGYKIERQPSGAAQRTDSADASQPSNVVRRTDPIICQGDRLMHIDGETIEFTGDAVIAERGCDLYISNARIRAGGVGIIARQARVHIVNSTIGGSRGSYEVSDGAEIYVARSTFTGVGRRFEGGSMTDLGGNSYSTH